VWQIGSVASTMKVIIFDLKVIFFDIEIRVALRGISEAQAHEPSPRPLFVWGDL